MRLSRTVALILLAASGIGSFPAHGASLEVRPAHRHAHASRPDPAGRGAPAVEAQSPEEQQWRIAQAERERRWREFPDDLMRHTDRSRFASRRVGWNRPAGRRSWPTRGDLEAAAGPGPVELARVAFIRIDFLNDRDGDKSSGTGRFDLSGPDTTLPPIDRPPHNRSFYLAHFEAFKRYYEAQAYGRLLVEGDVWPREQNRAYSVSDMADFGPWEFSQDIYGAAVHMFRTMLFAADSQSIVLGDRIPWNDYDRIVIIHAGSDLQSDVRRDSPHDIPSFTIGVADTEAVVFPDSVNRDRPIDRASFIPETGSQDGYYSAINGVLVHEAGHLMFGFYDVYDVNSGFPVVGYWSLMDYGNGVGSIVALPDGTEIFATGLLPPSIDPWHRFRFVLLDEVPFPEVSYGDTLQIHNIQRHPDVRRVTLSSDEYLMLENRWLAPADSVELDQDDSTRVVLGPKRPDAYEYDALLPGTGILVWHVDESVLPQEYTAPCDSTRANPDCGLNSNPFRRGLSIIEADGLDDLGDLGSPYLFGAPFDPYFAGNNATLSDSTVPSLIPHIGTRPHVRLSVLDPPDSVMRVSAVRSWQLPGWPVTSEFPAGGPDLLAADLDGDRRLEVAWAGGDPAGLAGGLFAVRLDGNGLFGPDLLVALVEPPPLPVMAALSLGQDLQGTRAPIVVSAGAGVDTVASFLAVTSSIDALGAGGQVWLYQVLANQAVPAPGWPPALPAQATTPPLIAGLHPNAVVYVGCADGRVYAIGLDGTVVASSDPPLPGGIRGRLAALPAPLAVAGGGGAGLHRIAAGGGQGDVAILGDGAGLAALSGWPQRLGTDGFEPDFLWLDFSGSGIPAAGTDCPGGAQTLVVHFADRLWAFCGDGTLLPGWGRSFGDTLVDALGAGDPDGDGFPEVLVQTIGSRIAFVNVSGFPSPGWPRPGSLEEFRSGSTPLAIDLDGDRRTEIVAMNASGIVAALSADGQRPAGWPLATGLGATGSPVAADLDRDGLIELIAPDRSGQLYGYSLPAAVSLPTVPTWPMLGGDPGRASALVLDPAVTAPAATAGPLVSGSLRAYPNPARRRPVSFAYQLTEPADVEFRILDTSGHEVASFTRRGRQADNLEVWDPGRLPAGLYVARLRFRGSGTERIETVPVGLLR